MINSALQRKVDQAIRLLKATAPKDGSPVEVAYSGGKDSDVILQLAKEAGINYRAIYKNTTIDPPGTIKHAEEIGAEIIRPKETFFDLVARKGYPSRTRRFCCEVLKEYKVLDKSIIGIRTEESHRRAKRYAEPTGCRIYKGDQHVEQIYPILNWTSEDVAEFIADRKRTCATAYYDETGTFHVERRLGCICCPQAYYKNRIEKFKEYPKFAKAYIRAGKRYMDSHPDSKIASKYDNEYEYFYRNVFCETEEDWLNASTGLFGKPDFKAFLEQQFGIKL